jgi:hypothetical protein
LNAPQVVKLLLLMLATHIQPPTILAQEQDRWLAVFDLSFRVPSAWTEKERSSEIRQLVASYHSHILMFDLSGLLRTALWSFLTRGGVGYCTFLLAVFPSFQV